MALRRKCCREPMPEPLPCQHETAEWWWMKGHKDPIWTCFRCWCFDPRRARVFS